MFMQRIRTATYKHRKLLLAVVIVLCLGMVGFFGKNAQNASKNSGSSSSDTSSSAVSQVAAYEKYIAENEPAAGSTVDYTKATSLANMYLQLSQFYYQALDEVKAANSTEAAQYATKGQEAATKSASYYQQCIDQAPDGTSDAAIAQLYVNTRQRPLLRRPGR